MKLAFSTLSCPTWDIEEIIDGARQSGYAGIELRGYQETLDLTCATPFVAANLAVTRSRFEEAGIELCCLGSSGVIGQKNLAHVRAYCALAHDLGCPYVRLFGGKPASFAEAAATLHEMAEIAWSYAVTLVLETHDDFSTGAAVGKLLAEVNHPAARALWDLHHPFRLDESPEETLRSLGPYLSHVHIKDGLKDSGYTLLGDGDLPLKSMLAQLKAHGYDGFVSVEWEKRWHPGLAEPEIALPQHARVLREFLRALPQP
jgi:sugar phosphate isomerase/epimerase